MGDGIIIKIWNVKADSGGKAASAQIGSAAVGRALRAPPSRGKNARGVPESIVTIKLSKKDSAL